MPRGGARPGAGRKPDAPEVRAEKAAKRAQAGQRARDRQVAAEKVKESYAPSGVKAPAAPKDWPFGTAPAEPPKAEEKPEVDPDPVIGGDTPLEFLVAVMKADDVKLAVRMQAAAIAAPFLHAKPAPVGKKAQQREDAAKAGGTKSKFAAATPPKLAAAGGKRV